MDVIVAALSEQHSELAGLLNGLDEADFHLPAPSCEGWDIADVVLHLAQTDELAIASVRGTFDSGFTELFRDEAGERPPNNVDEAAEVMVVAERGETGAAIRDRWRTRTDELRAAFAACAPSTRVQWVAGDMSARTLATTRLSETWIHTGDVAEALGVELAPPGGLWHIVRLAWRTVPYAFARSGRELTGPVAFELRAPNGDRWELLPDTAPATTIRGDAIDLARVAARRAEPAQTSLHGDGPDVRTVLELVRTYASARRVRQLDRRRDRAVDDRLNDLGNLDRVQRLLGRHELSNCPPPLVEERSLLDRLPTVSVRHESRDVHGEEPLGLSKLPLVELELGDSSRDDRTKLVARKVQTGLLVHLTRRGSFERLTVVDATAGRQPPRSGVGARRITALDHQHGLFRYEQSARGAPFDHHGQSFRRATCNTAPQWRRRRGSARCDRRWRISS